MADKKVDEKANKLSKKKEGKGGHKIGRFFRDVWSEIKKLTWPTGKELVSYTLTVLGFIIVMAVIIYVLDFAFGEGLGLLSKVKSTAETTAEAFLIH